MTPLILLFVVLNLIAGETSWRGRRLTLNRHPVFVRVRWFAFGLAAALLVTGHAIAADDGVSWFVVILLALGVARVPIVDRDASVRS